MPARKFIKVNLLPKDAFETSILGNFLRWSLTIGRIMVVLTEFVVILAFSSRFWFDKKLNDLKESNNIKQHLVQSYIDTEQKMREVLSRQEAVENFLSNRLEVAQGLSQLRSLFPSSTVLDEINFLQNQVNIIGFTGSEYGLAQTILAMKSYKNADWVEVKKVEFNQKKGGIEFEINTQIKTAEND